MDYIVYLPISLADFNTTGLAVDCAAILLRTTATGPNLYADSDRGGTDSPLAGELGLGGTETVISRIYWSGAPQNQLRFNDNESPAGLDMGVYFSALGGGANSTLHILYRDAGGSLVHAQVAVSELTMQGGGNFINLTNLPAAFIGALNAITPNRRWLFAVTQPSPNVPPAFSSPAGSPISMRIRRPIDAVTVPAATGRPAPTYAVYGALPNGLAFDTATRILSGTPTAEGNGTITIRATNSAGHADWTVNYAFLPPRWPLTLPAWPGTAGTWSVGALIARIPHKPLTLLPWTGVAGDWTPGALTKRPTKALTVAPWPGTPGTWSVTNLVDVGQVEVVQVPAWPGVAGDWTVGDLTIRPPKALTVAPWPGVAGSLDVGDLTIRPTKALTIPAWPGTPGSWMVGALGIQARLAVVNLEPAPWPGTPGTWSPGPLIVLPPPGQLEVAPWPGTPGSWSVGAVTTQLGHVTLRTYILAAIGPYPNGAFDYLWDGPDDTVVYRGRVYRGTRGAISVLAVSSGIEGGESRVQVQIPLVDKDARMAALDNHGPVPVALTWIVSDNGGATYRADPAREFMGRVAAPRVEDDFYIIEVETWLGDADRLHVDTWSDESQQRRFPGDDGFKYQRVLGQGLDLPWPP